MTSTEWHRTQRYASWITMRLRDGGGPSYEWILPLVRRIRELQPLASRLTVETLVVDWLSHRSVRELPTGVEELGR